MSTATSGAGPASAAATQAEAYYADQLGYFKQAGITATLSSAARSAETLQLVARGDHHGARAQAEQALAICPNLSAAHGALGVILATRGNRKRGLRHSKHAFGSTRVRRPW